MPHYGKVENKGKPILYSMIFFPDCKQFSGLSAIAAIRLLLRRTLVPSVILCSKGWVPSIRHQSFLPGPAFMKPFFPVRQMQFLAQ
jgi:hypothetical protein